MTANNAPAAVYVHPSQLQAWARNPRDNDDAVEQVAESIRRFGFGAPIVARAANSEVIAGHTRLRAALLLGLEEVPVRFLDVDETDARLLSLADNKLGEIAEWSDDLSAVLAELQAAGADTSLLGWTEQQLARLVAGDELEEPAVGDPPADPVTRLGDVWLLGRHRLVCGDSTLQPTIDQVARGEKAAICWTDPPYNIGYEGGLASHDEVAQAPKRRRIANDNMGDAFPGFCAALAGTIYGNVLPGAAIYVTMAPGEWHTIQAALLAAGFHWSSTIIWAKQRFNPGRRDYHGQYEPMWYGWHGGAPRRVPLEDRTQSDLWSIDRPQASIHHPTTKPIELVARALTNSSRAGDVVLEPFGGSGTTLLAAEQTDRTCWAAELDPGYCDVIVQRWEELTGGKAVRE